jgi:hypothetical protein
MARARGTGRGREAERDTTVFSFLLIFPVPRLVIRHWTGPNRLPYNIPSWDSCLRFCRKSNQEVMYGRNIAELLRGRFDRSKVARKGYPKRTGPPKCLW